MNDDEILGIILWAALLVTGALFYCYSASDHDTPKRVLENLGYSSVVVGSGHAIGKIYGCADEEIAYLASADNPLGKRASLTVCCGVVLKACTVRSR